MPDQQHSDGDERGERQAEAVGVDGHRLEYVRLQHAVHAYVCAECAHNIEQLAVMRIHMASKLTGQSAAGPGTSSA